MTNGIGGNVHLEVKKDGKLGEVRVVTKCDDGGAITPVSLIAQAESSSIIEPICVLCGQSAGEIEQYTVSNTDGGDKCFRWAHPECLEAISTTTAPQEGNRKIIVELSRDGDGNLDAQTHELN